MALRGLGTVYAFDTGQNCGWCRGAPGEPPESGSWGLYTASEGIEQGFANFIACLCEQFEEVRPSLVVWAKPMSAKGNSKKFASETALRSQLGFRAILCGVAKRYGAKVKEIHEATVRVHFVGQGRAKKGVEGMEDEDIKQIVLNRCRLIQLVPPGCEDTDRTDACAIHDWAVFAYSKMTDRKLYLFGEKPSQGAKVSGKRKKRTRAGGGLV